MKRKQARQKAEVNELIREFLTETIGKMLQAELDDFLS